MKNNRNLIVYAILLTAAVAMVFFNLVTDNISAFRQWWITMTVLCGLITGAIHSEDNNKPVLTTLAACSGYLALALPIAFGSWAPWVILSIIFSLLFMLFGMIICFGSPAPAESSER